MKTFSVLGGDNRSVVIANELCLRGYAVNVFAHDSSGFNQSVKICDSIASSLKDANYILLPMPCSTVDGCLHAPMYDQSVSMQDIINKMRPGQLVFGGKIEEQLAKSLTKHDMMFFDYALREELVVLNAVATAEGAILIALKELPCTLNGLPVLVTGFGRIAKVLANILKGMGADVTVSARKQSDIAWMKAYGYKAMPISDLKNNLQTFGLIYNTVPFILFERDLLRLIHKDCLLIDLASKPGGVDFESAKHMQKNVIHALSLPGKTAPQTAGLIVCDTVLNMIDESEVKE